MSEDINSKKVICLEDLKIVTDDIYSRLREKADKKILIDVANMEVKNDVKIINTIEEECLKKDEYYRIFPEGINPCYYTLPLISKYQICLYYHGWDAETKQQTIEDPDIHCDSFVFLSLPLDTPDDEINEFTAANIVPYRQADGEITLKYTGEEPKRDFTLDMCVIS